MAALGENGIIACSGEMADFQDIVKSCDQKYEEDLIQNDGACFFHPKDYFNWLAKTQYQRRLKANPLYVTAVVGGIDKKDGVFLGTTDFHGTKIEDQNFVATGLGLHYC